MSFNRQHSNQSDESWISQNEHLNQQRGRYTNNKTKTANVKQVPDTNEIKQVPLGKDVNDARNLLFAVGNDTLIKILHYLKVYDFLTVSTTSKHFQKIIEAKNCGSIGAYWKYQLQLLGVKLDEKMSQKLGSSAWKWGNFYFQWFMVLFYCRIIKLNKAKPDGYELLIGKSYADKEIISIVEQYNKGEVPLSKVMSSYFCYDKDNNRLNKYHDSNVLDGHATILGTACQVGYQKTNHVIDYLLSLSLQYVDVTTGTSYVSFDGDGFDCCMFSTTESPLMVLISNYRIEPKKRLTAAKAFLNNENISSIKDVDFWNKFCGHNANGDNVFTLAVSLGLNDIAVFIYQYLIQIESQLAKENGINIYQVVNQTDRRGRTPYMVACSEENTTMIKKLIEKCPKVDISIKNSQNDCHGSDYVSKDKDLQKWLQEQENRVATH